MGDGGAPASEMGVTGAGFPQTLVWPPPPQVAGAAQVPQVRTLPQPSETVPHVALFEAQVAGLHFPEPHVLAPPPPHVCEPAHVPHVRLPLQPSEIAPHVAPWAAHVVGTQAATLGSPASSPVGEAAAFGSDGSPDVVGESPGEGASEGATTLPESSPVGAASPMFPGPQPLIHAAVRTVQARPPEKTRVETCIRPLIEPCMDIKSA
jgi:hypothetical protein